MCGGRLKTLHHELQEPTTADAHRPADPAQRDAFHEQPLNEGTLRLRNQVIFWIQDKGPTTPLAAVVLFAGMNVAVSLEPR